MNVFVQGASRGIGLAFVRQLLDRPDVEVVFASARQPERASALIDLEQEHGARLQLVTVDVCSEAQIEASAAFVSERCARIHLLINAAGILHGPEQQPEKRLEQVHAAALMHSFQVNAFAPLLTVKHFCPLLTHDERAVVANISARVGSIADNRLGGWYAYRGSKAAQNMLTKTLSIELARRAPNVICTALHPGTVDTALSGPFQRNVPKQRLFSPERATRQLLEVIDSLRPEDSGSFLAWNREPIPW